MFQKVSNTNLPILKAKIFNCSFIERDDLFDVADFEL
jgi:hypothetical protein